MVSEPLIIAAIALSALSGVPGLWLASERRVGERLATASMTAAGLCACASAIASLAFGAGRELDAAWQVPGGRFAIAVDAISAMFVLQIAALSTLGSWYGLEYWPQHAHRHDGKKLRAFYGTVTAGMLLLVVAKSAVLFLAGWEVMALSAFVLISTEDERAPVREVGYLYLVCTRAGTLCLFAMFALCATASGSFDLDAWPRALATPSRDAIFVLGLCGFGLKAGIMPLHVWLPGAHANAPSHVSALMSGVLIKMGIYGLVRLCAACLAPPPWWGYTLIALGALSGVLGVCFAIGQHDLKRLLAYHSVENIGIICIGLGVAVLGRALGRVELVALGIAGALLHVWNHGLFKALLFLSAGAVLHATGTREIDRLGGLSRRMPHTALAFLVGAVAICGLPPLNGLISELFIYLALIRNSAESGGAWLAATLAMPALALIGALAVACFVKVFGAVFLGLPRSADVERAHEVGPLMLAPMALLAAACLFIGIAAPLVARVLDGAVAVWARSSAPPPALGALAPLAWVSAASAALLLVLWVAGRRVFTSVLRRAGRAAPPIGTWDCGYAAPGARMQYTSSSFAQLLVGLFAWALRPEIQPARLSGPFSAPAAFRSHVPDTVLDRALLPAFQRACRLLERLHAIQRGSVHMYLFYIVATLVFLLVWV